MDQYIERKISHFLNGNDQSEKRLAELNSEVSSAVKLFRASQQPKKQVRNLPPIQSGENTDTRDNTELREQRFSKSQVVTARNRKVMLFDPEIQKLVVAMTNNKGIGMTEAEWNDITVKNAQDFKNEAAQKKKKQQE